MSLIVFSLTFLGLVILFSVSQSMHEDPTTLLRKQAIWLVFATLAGVFTMIVKLEALRPYAFVLAGGSVLMLVLVLIPGIGVRVNGAQRWMDFGPMRLQVSEIGKLGFAFCDGTLLSPESSFFRRCYAWLYRAMWYRSQ